MERRCSSPALPTLGDFLAVARRSPARRRIPTPRRGAGGSPAQRSQPPRPSPNRPLVAGGPRAGPTGAGLVRVAAAERSSAAALQPDLAQATDGAVRMPAGQRSMVASRPEPASSLPSLLGQGPAFPVNPRPTGGILGPRPMLAWRSQDVRACLGPGCSKASGSIQRSEVSPSASRQGPTKPIGAESAWLWIHTGASDLTLACATSSQQIRKHRWSARRIVVSKPSAPLLLSFAAAVMKRYRSRSPSP